MITFDRTPMMADVISGAVKRPREKRPNESYDAWLSESVLAKELDIASLIPVDRQFSRFAESDLVHIFRSGYDLIGINADATRYAVEERSAFVTWEQMREQIVEQMAQRGLTQTELSRRCGISQQHLSATLGGQFTPKIDTVIRICDAIGLKLEIA